MVTGLVCAKIPESKESVLEMVSKESVEHFEGAKEAASSGVQKQESGSDRISRMPPQPRR
jgi:hypothetical protein